MRATRACTAPPALPRPEILSEKGRGAPAARAIQQRTPLQPVSTLVSLHALVLKSPQLDAAHDSQTRAGNLLAELLRAPQPQQRATELADQLDADFFAVASAYLAMAQKENNEEVIKDLQRVIKIAMAAKNALLRPGTP